MAALQRHRLPKLIVRVRFPSPAPLKAQIKLHPTKLSDLESLRGRPCHPTCLRLGCGLCQPFKLTVRLGTERADQRSR